MIINAKNNFLIVAAIFAVVLSGAYYFDIDPFSVDNNKKPSDEELAAFFQKNHLELKKIIPLCQEHPVIRWLGADSRKASFENHTNPSPMDYEAAEKMRSIIKDIGVRSIDCDRKYLLEGFPLSGVSYSIYARGLSVSGEHKGLRFDIDSSQGKISEGYQRELEAGRLKPLPEPGWYINSSE